VNVAGLVEVFSATLIVMVLTDRVCDAATTPAKVLTGGVFPRAAVKAELVKVMTESLHVVKPGLRV
jgi:hypothetical protein